MKFYLSGIIFSLTILTGCSGFESGVESISHKPPSSTRPICGSTFQVDWDKNPESNLAGYKIYYGAATRSYSTVIEHLDLQITRHRISNLVSGDYFVALTAFDENGIESEYSEEVYVDLKPCESVFINMKK